MQGEERMAKLVAHMRLIAGAFGFRIHCRNGGSGFGPAAELGQSECRCGEGATIAPAAQDDSRAAAPFLT